jgi:hypothetical protein
MADSLHPAGGLLGQNPDPFVFHLSPEKFGPLFSSHNPQLGAAEPKPSVRGINPKSEFRNPKQIQNPKEQTNKQKASFRIWEIWICFEIRISCFEFRIEAWGSKK